MFGEVGACNSGGLGVDLGVQALELARMTFECVRVGGDLGSVLVCTTRSLSVCSLLMLIWASLTKAIPKTTQTQQHVRTP